MPKSFTRVNISLVIALNIIGEEHFKEVYVSKPTSVYEQRDSKKL